MYSRRGIGQCDPVLNPAECTGPNIVPIGNVTGGQQAYALIQGDPYVAPTGTAPSANLMAGLPTYLIYGALAVGAILLIKAAS